MKKLNLDLIRRSAHSLHEHVNHKYGELPYKFHLDMVEKIGQRHEIILDTYFPEIKQDIIAALPCHDLIEDCRMTWNDVFKLTGSTIATDIVYAVSNEKGKNRAERANAKYYRGIRNTPGATFVKLCDRLANVQFSSSNANKKMIQVYKKENVEFLKHLEPTFFERCKAFFTGKKFPDYTPIIDEINKHFE